VTQIEVYPNAPSGWWARFTFNGITRYDQGAYDLVGCIAEGIYAGASLSKRSSRAERGRALPIRMNGMSPLFTLPTDARLEEMAAVIHGVIPGSEVRLFGSRARGTAGPESDIDLLITAPDSWLEERNRFEVLNQLWGLLARADVSLDLLLYSRLECEQHRNWRSHVIGRALREGRLIDGAF
jgi:predicted nucleotidyltransferase